MVLGEVLGTATLILFGDGVVAGALLNRSKSQNAGWVVITFAWGLGVYMGVLVATAVEGGLGHINPAVTLALAAIGPEDFNFAWGDVPVLIAGQFLGAALGATLVWLSYLPHWGATEDKGLKLAVYCTGPAVRNYGANLVTEIIGTFALVFGILALAPANEAIGGALAVGLLVVVIGMALGGPTGYAINPARDLGPRIMHFVLPIDGKGESDWGYSWIPVVGPIIGGILGAIVGNAAFG
jgi:glycerol uptake facilitator protein